MLRFTADKLPLNRITGNMAIPLLIPQYETTGDEMINLL
jgi:hypothetical protein